MPAQLLKSAKPTPGSKSQQVPQGQQPSAPQVQQGGFSGHKEIKLTLLNKVTFPAGWHSLLAGIPCSQGQQGGWILAGGELRARRCWDELSREGLGLARRAAHRTSLAAHALWWLHFGAVLAASLGHIPAAASRLFPACSKVPRVPGPFPLGDAPGTLPVPGQSGLGSARHRVQRGKWRVPQLPGVPTWLFPFPLIPLPRFGALAADPNPQHVGELGLVGFGAGAGCWPHHVGRFLFLIFCSASPNSPAQSEAADLSTSLCSDVRRLYQRQEAALEGGVCSDT